MDDDPVRPQRRHTLGDDLSRLSVRELEALRETLRAEIERVEREIAAKDFLRTAADAFFRR